MPVIVTVNGDAVVELQERVAVCGEVPKVTLLGEIALQVRPLGTTSVSSTVPVKPLTVVTVIVEVVDEPTAPDGEVADMGKSVTVNFAVVVWVILPLLPIIVTV